MALVDAMLAVAFVLLAGDGAHLCHLAAGALATARRKREARQR